MVIECLEGIEAEVDEAQLFRKVGKILGAQLIFNT